MLKIGRHSHCSCIKTDKLESISPIHNWYNSEMFFYSSARQNNSLQWCRSYIYWKCWKKYIYILKIKLIFYGIKTTDNLTFVSLRGSHFCRSSPLTVSTHFRDSPILQTHLAKKTPKKVVISAGQTESTEAMDTHWQCLASDQWPGVSGPSDITASHCHMLTLVYLSCENKL